MPTPVVNNANSNPAAVHSAERHPRYYLEGGDLHVLVGKVLFRVHSHFFTRESTTFHRKVHPVTLGTKPEGRELNPVILDNITPDHFESFLWVIYNPRYSIYEASVDRWRVILNLANEWGFQEVKDLAVRELHQKPELDLVDRLVLYQEFKVDSCYLVPLYSLLCSRDTPLSVQESKILGVETSVLIARMREQLRSAPSNGGRSPLPDGLETPDVFRALERELSLEEGVTARTYQEHRLAVPTIDVGHAHVNGDVQPNGIRGRGRGVNRGRPNIVT